MTHLFCVTIMLNVLVGYNIVYSSRSLQYQIKIVLNPQDMREFMKNSEYSLIKFIGKYKDIYK